VTGATATSPVEVRSTRSLTGTQARIWAAQRLDPDAPVANMATTTRLRGPLDAARLLAAFDDVVAAADALRSVVDPDPAGPRWRVLEAPPARAEVVDLPRDLPSVRGDERALKQILVNLLSNAIKFTPKGGRIVTRAQVLGNGDLQLSVADTGVGMRDADIARALEPFQQVYGGLDRKHEGAGLGLPLCKRLAELHSGSLTIESAPGSGTSVLITLPSFRVVARHRRPGDPGTTDGESPATAQRHAERIAS